jgi:hypothetical protein
MGCGQDGKCSRAKAELYVFLTILPLYHCSKVKTAILSVSAIQFVNSIPLG